MLDKVLLIHHECFRLRCMVWIKPCDMKVIILVNEYVDGKRSKHLLYKSILKSDIHILKSRGDSFHLFKHLLRLPLL